MSDRRKRGHNFTLEEKQRLIKFLLEHRKAILNKKTDGATNEAKLVAWNELTASFNASSTNYRSKKSLMKVWEKLKSESKIYYSSSHRSYTQTVSGPSVMKTDPILEQVCDIMGRAVGSLCSSFNDMNKKKEEVEDSKYILLKEELVFKQKLYEIQLQSAKKDLMLKDLEIKIKQAQLLKMLAGGNSTNN